MAKTAQINIKVETSSLEELNQEIKTLEASISKLKVGTKEWIVQNQKLGTLKNQFSSATYEAQKLQKVVEKVGSAEQLRAVAKVGAGLAAGFVGVQSTLSLLGATGNKTFDEITAKGVALIGIMGSLNQIADLFSKETFKGIAAIGAGFKTLVTTVRAASLAMKAALISTGIGALIVGVGLLVANWDKIKGLITGASKKQEEANAQAIASAKSQQKITKSELDLQKELLATEEKRAELTGDYTTVARLRLSIAQEEATVLQNEKRTIEATLKDIEDKASKIGIGFTLDKFDLKDQYGWNELKKEEKKILEDLDAEYHVNRNMLVSIGLQLDNNYDVVQKTAEQYKIQAGNIDKLNIQIGQSEDRLKLLNVQEFKKKEILNQQLSIIKDQIDILERSRIDTLFDPYKSNEENETIKIRNNELNKSAEIKINSLKAQRNALIEQERLRVKAQKLEVEEAQAGYEKQVALANINTEYSNSLVFLTKMLSLSINAEKKLIGQADALERQKKTTLELQKLIVDNKKSNEKEIEQYERINRLRIENLDVGDHEIINTAERLRLNIKGVKIDENSLTRGAELLVLEEKIANKKKETIQLTIDDLDRQTEFNNLELDRIDKLDTAAKLEKESLNNKIKAAEIEQKGANAEKRAKLELDIVGYKSEILTINEQINSNNVEYVKLTNDNLSNEKNITKALSDQKVISDELVVTTAQITENVRIQSMWQQQLGDFMKKYQQEIQLSYDILMESLSLIIAIHERKVIRLQKKINDAQQNLDNINAAEIDHAQRLLDLNEQLKDANGQRYDDLLRLIDEESAAQAASDAKKLDAENKLIDLKNQQLKAEYEAAKWRKAQAIIDATIKAALAVIAQLSIPLAGIGLAVAVGVLGALSIATIAAQAVPEPTYLAKKTQLKEGGYTSQSISDDQVAGVVHANEYVVPAWQVRKNPSIVEALEEQRTKGYAQGGYVQPVQSNGNSQTSLILDYDRLAEAMSKLPNPQVSLVAISKGVKDVELTKSKASLSR